MTLFVYNLLAIEVIALCWLFDVFYLDTRIL